MVSSPLTDSKLRFVLLHQRHFVETWQALFGGAMVRARTDRGVTATLTEQEVHELVRDGIMTRGWGGMMHLTDAGKIVK